MSLDFKSLDTRTYIIKYNLTRYLVTLYNLGTEWFLQEHNNKNIALYLHARRDIEKETNNIDF